MRQRLRGGDNVRRCHLGKFQTFKGLDGRLECKPTLNGIARALVRFNSSSLTAPLSQQAPQQWHDR